MFGIGKLLLVIVNEVEGEVLVMFVVNNLCGMFKSCVICLFGFGEFCME